MNVRQERRGVVLKQPDQRAVEIHTVLLTAEQLGGRAISNIFSLPFLESNGKFFTPKWSDFPNSQSLIPSENIMNQLQRLQKKHSNTIFAQNCRYHVDLLYFRRHPYERSPC